VQQRFLEDAEETHEDRTSVDATVDPRIILRDGDIKKEFF
jgi:hypothetical protein